MTDTYATYGPDVVAWVLAALGTAGTFLLGLMGVARWSALVRGVIQRAWVEVQGAVLEINQTYVSELRKAREDGELTEAEKLTARTRAVEVAKANLGKKGLARLARVVGINPDEWIASKVEQAVAKTKIITGGSALPEIVEGAVRAATGTTLPPPIAIGAPAAPDPRRPAR